MADNKEHGTQSPGNRKASATTDFSNVLENVLELTAMTLTLTEIFLLELKDLLN
jgi:hypothetical protein